MTCQDTTLSLGVYLLGSLDASEREAVEAHLRDCPACRVQLAELAELPAMLSQLTVDDFVPEPVEVPEDLFDRVAERAREEHRRGESSRVGRYRRLTAVAAVAVVIAGAGVGALVVSHDSGHGSGVVATAQVASATKGSVTMRVVLASQAQGTGLRVTVSGLPRDEHCWLVAVAKDGSRDVAGRWDATYLGKAQETGSTTIPKSELAQLVLVGTHGEQLVTVPV